MKRTLLLAATLVASAGAGLAATNGCVYCDDSVCSSTLWIYFHEPEGGPLADGEWHIEVTIDEVRDEAHCTVADDGHALRCDGLEGELHAPIYDDPDHPHEVFELYYEDDPPDELAVRITHDGVVRFDQTLMPDYDLAEPECDDDCLESMNHLELAP